MVKCSALNFSSVNPCFKQNAKRETRDHQLLDEIPISNFKLEERTNTWRWSIVNDRCKRLNLSSLLAGRESKNISYHHTIEENET